MSWNISGPPLKKPNALLNLEEVERLLAAGEFDEFLSRLEKVAQDNNLLWRRVPSAGDTAVLTHPSLDKATFCTQVRNLLYGDRPSPERLQSFSDYLADQGLPNGWPLPTYLLFMVHPQQEMLVKPQAAQWFLRFVGETAVTVTAPPTAQLYALIRRHAQDVLAALADYGAQDMVDVQSVLWVAYREGHSRTGRLNERGQVELDVPPTEPMEGISETAVFHENKSSYMAPAAKQPAVTMAQLAQETGFAAAELTHWTQAIHRKGQAVFYGPPGTSKTFLAQQLARHITGGGDGLVELVQFHPAYSYEDFIQGIRPVTAGGQVRYEMQNGRFQDFCQRAAQRSGHSVFIIDELNRANIASVFGELMVLLEYRETAVPLAGGGEFAIPANVRILATMNTADRSIALVDHALRRRFAFIYLAPNFKVLRHYHKQHQTGFDPNALIKLLTTLNAQINDPHYHVGHSFFLDSQLPQNLATIWQMEIEPYLEEYFYNQPGRIDGFRWHQVQKML